jgi:hypothetical protein
MDVTWPMLKWAKSQPKSYIVSNFVNNSSPKPLYDWFGNVTRNYMTCDDSIRRFHEFLNFNIIWLVLYLALSICGIYTRWTHNLYLGIVWVTHLQGTFYYFLQK